MKKTLFRFVASAMTLAMLLPCVLVAPASAVSSTFVQDKAKNTIWSYTPKHTDTARQDFIEKQFPSNIRMDFTTKSSNYNYSYYYVRVPNFYTPEGPRTFLAQEMAGQFRPAVWSGSMNSNTAVNGVPYRLTDGGQIKQLENLKFELGDVEYPIITDDLYRIGEHSEMDSLFLCVMHFLGTGRKFLFSTTIYDRSICSKPQCSTGCVHGNISATDHDNLLTCMDRSHIIFPVCLHEIVTGKELIG